MKKFKQLVALLFLSFAFNASIAQAKDINITGKVISFEESLGLEGVSIAAKTSGKNSGTQADGTFSIAISHEDSTLIFSLGGYQTQEIKIGTDTDYTIILRRSEDNEQTKQSNNVTLKK